MIGGNQPTEPNHFEDELPPWPSDDIFFDPPSSIFASPGHIEPQADIDPWFSDELWSNALNTSLLLGPTPQAQQPSRAQSSTRSVAGPQQVSPDDELSDTELHNQHRGQPRISNQLNPFATPSSAIGQGEVPGIPLLQRTGSITISDQQLSTLFVGTRWHSP